MCLCGRVVLKLICKHNYHNYHCSQTIWLSDTRLTGDPGAPCQGWGRVGEPCFSVGKMNKWMTLVGEGGYDLEKQKCMLVDLSGG